MLNAIAYAGAVMLAAGIMAPQRWMQSLLLGAAALTGAMFSAAVVNDPILAGLFMLAVLAAVIREVRAALAAARGQSGPR